MADESMVFGDEDEEGYTDTYVPQWDPEASPHLPAFHDFRQVHSVPQHRPLIELILYE